MSFDFAEFQKVPKHQRKAWLAANDWTVDPETGCSNSSVIYLNLCNEVERLIRGSAHSLIAGRTGDVASLIVAQLAHEHNMEPKGWNDPEQPSCPRN